MKSKVKKSSGGSIGVSRNLGSKSTRIAKHVEALAPSGIRAFFDLVLGMRDVISLGVGEPDFVTPWHIREKAISSLEQGYTSYTSNKGMIQLRRQISRFLDSRYSLSYDPEEECLITVGVSEGLDLAVRAILNPGEKVIIPEPCYVSYSAVVELAGGKVIRVKTEASNGFKVTPKQLTDACKQGGVKALMINYPSNPTGASYSKQELEEFATIIKKYDLLVLSDEVYDELTYDFAHTPFAAINGMKDRVIYLNGFSKSYAMTGFRLGWACGPEEVIAAMTKIHQYTMLCAPITAQIAAEEALKNGARAVAEMKREYDRRRRFMVGALNDLGLQCHNPEGAFYVFPSIKSTKMSSMDFAQGLLKDKKVALVPGVAFGPSFDDHIRISYASSYENLKEAIVRIGAYLKNPDIRHYGVRMADPDSQDIDFEINFYEGILHGRSDFFQVWVILAELYTKKGLYSKGLELDKKLAEARPEDPYILYNLTCSYSLLGETEKALGALKLAVESGYQDFTFLQSDNDLANLRQDARFQEYFAQIKKV